MNKPCKSFGLFLMAGFLAFSATVRADDLAPSSRRDHNLILGLPGGLKYTATRMAGRPNLLILATGSILTASIWNTARERGYDNALERKAKNESIYDFGNFWGNGITQGILAAGTWSTGRAFHFGKLQAFGFDASTALVGSALCASALKVAVNRTRPNGAHYSFPSGHATSAFSIVPAAWKYGGWKTGIPMILAGVATGLGRMEDHRHYLSDVTAGAALGLLFGEAACGSDGKWVPKLRAYGNKRFVEVAFQW